MAPLRQTARDRILLDTAAAQRRRVSARQIATRLWMLRIVKLALPVLALALLLLVVLWPEFAKMNERAQMSVHRLFALQAESGRMLEPRYRSVDEKSRPYTLTASWASQSGGDQVDLGDPKGDMMLENGTWLEVIAKNGVFVQRTELLDLSHDVVLYRDDGTTLRTETAAADIKQGAVSSAAQTHAEGPFGVLDAQGFTLVDKGNAIQFYGPARLTINQAAKPPAGAPP